MSKLFNVRKILSLITIYKVHGYSKRCILSCYSYCAKEIIHKFVFFVLNDLSININIKQIEFFPCLLYYKTFFTTFNISLLLQNKLCEFPTCTHKFKRLLCSRKVGFKRMVWKRSKIYVNYKSKSDFVLKWYWRLKIPCYTTQFLTWDKFQ